MTSHTEDVERATAVWQAYCQTLEATGVAALEKTMTDNEIDVAEGLRHLTRMIRLTAQSQVENRDTAHPYFARMLSYDVKSGGDNPGGLYLAAPINGVDTFRIRGTRGSSRWFSVVLQRHPEAVMAGHAGYGATMFDPDLHVEDDGTFELVLAPEKQQGNWLRTDPYSAMVLVRQFFATYDAVVPADLTVENVTRGDEPKQPLLLDDAVDRVERASFTFAMAVPMMQDELLDKASTVNSFHTDIGDATSNLGGVPGGNAVTSRWRLEPDEALVVRVTPPVPCAYWDAQVGNGWYESWDYRHFFSGLTCEQAAVGADGTVTIVVSAHDPATANWLETAHHREGHIAIRWQLTDGQLPIPSCTVVPVSQVPKLTGLPPVTPQERRQQRTALRRSVEHRFRL